MNANQKDDWYANICTHLENPATYAKLEDFKLRGCRVSKSLLIKKNQFWIPDNEGLQLEVLKEVHDQLAVGHPGVKRTLAISCRHYYWPHMYGTIELYTQNCHVCKRAKAACNTYDKLL